MPSVIHDSLTRKQWEMVRNLQLSGVSEIINAYTINDDIFMIIVYRGAASDDDTTDETSTTETQK